MRRLWVAFAGVVVLSFLVLGYLGVRIYQEMPPVPERVVTTAGVDVIEPGDIARGQNVWQSMGGMEVGSIWGHGSYVAPDWTADWLHRESTFILDHWSRGESGRGYDERSDEDQPASSRADADLGRRRARLLVREKPGVPAERSRRPVRWLRVIGDTIFAAGVVAIVLFTLGLKTGQSLRRESPASLAVPTPSRV